MRPLSLSALSSCAPTSLQSTVANAYVTKELPIAQAGLLANIGPNGAKSSGAYPGIVIASPSTRSSTNFIASGGSAASMSSLIDMFVSAEANIQQVASPSGNVTTGGLGEPKFMINETAFTGAWGRPQRDGPALRATTLITYANWLLQQDNVLYVTSALWPVIQLDLDYVASSWNLSTYDLWEEVYAYSFFTSAAATLGHSDLESNYAFQADRLLCFLQSFWNSSSGYIIANPGVQRSGIDANTVLASIHTFDVDAGCDATTYQPCSDKALANLKVYVDSFRGVYTINSGVPENEAVATGRYFEDVYQGGNPWYLTTFAVAEQLYDALIVWNKQGYLDVTDVSLDFFRTFDVSVSTGTYTASSSTYGTLMCAIKSFADGFVAVNANYTPSDGSLAEQYSRTDGLPVSAVDLTWSYASALTAFAALEGQSPVTWGAQALSVSSTCYSPVSVTFNVDATTAFGENIYLTGSLPALSSWDASTAIPMSSANYPIWSTTASLPPDTPIQYKYIRKDANSVTWESDPNNAFTTVASGSQMLDDLWR
ncbi:glycoside hydrolase family 15 protein [Pisolithus albus]|nr:glycoside hydrolase family 15 protein [Pisolithus albus]